MTKKTDHINLRDLIVDEMDDSVVLRSDHLDALLDAVRTLKWVCDANCIKELNGRALVAESMLNRFTDEEPDHD